MAAKTITTKKNYERLKDELMNSLRGGDAVEEIGIIIANVTEPGEAITIIKSYEEIIKIQNKKTITYVAKQRQL